MASSWQTELEEPFSEICGSGPDDPRLLGNEVMDGRRMTKLLYKHVKLEDEGHKAAKNPKPQAPACEPGWEEASKTKEAEPSSSSLPAVVATVEKAQNSEAVTGPTEIAALLEALEERHEREVREMEDLTRQRVSEVTLKAGKGKKATQLIEAAYREVEQWKYNLHVRQKEEMEDLMSFLEGPKEPKQEEKVENKACRDEEEKVKRKRARAQQKRQRKAEKEAAFGLEPLDHEAVRIPDPSVRFEVQGGTVEPERATPFNLLPSVGTWMMRRYDLDTHAKPGTPPERKPKSHFEDFTREVAAALRELFAGCCVRDK